MIPGNMFGVSGNESVVIDYIKEKFGGEVDSLGSLIVRKEGKGKKIAVACPIDESGLFVTDLSDGIRFELISKSEALSLVNRTVSFQNGIRGIICTNKSEPSVSDLYIEADGEVKIGDIARFSFDQIENGDKIIGHSVERCLCADAVISVMESLKDTGFDITYIFATMYRIGKKGLNAALLNNRPDYTVVIDTVSGDKIKCGSGPVIKITDGSYTADPLLHEYAKKKNVNLIVCKESEIRSANSFSYGAVCGYVSIPVEKACGIVKGNYSDSKKCADLVCDFIKLL